VNRSSQEQVIETRELVYQAGPDACDGYLAEPAGHDGRHPGVLVLHEWWGHNAYVRHRAEQLAELGYTALAVDMFGSGRTADTPDEAQALMQGLMGDPATVRRRFHAARDQLLEQPGVDPHRLAAIGYCMGGGIVLDMARAGEALAGVVAFHGTLGATEPAKPGKVRARVLALIGSEDAFSPTAEQDAFEREMRAAGADYELVRYPGVQHAFTNPAVDAKAAKYGLPLAYDAAADHDSWQRMRDFLQHIFA
jgi:dienelactone hydrolase